MTSYADDEFKLWLECDWEGCYRKTLVLTPDYMKEGWGFMRNPSDPLSDFHFCPDHTPIIIEHPEVKEEIREGKHIKSLQEREEFYR